MDNTHLRAHKSESPPENLRSQEKDLKLILTPPKDVREDINVHDQLKEQTYETNNSEGNKSEILRLKQHPKRSTKIIEPLES